jgi:phosphopantothenoylcysteine decarboxylase/phosphopantothenate--cysteine ligase
MKDARPTVVLAMTGSIAAYKAPIVARRLIERGIRDPRHDARRSSSWARHPLRADGRPYAPTPSTRAARASSTSSFGAVADVVAIVPATADVIAPRRRARRRSHGHLPLRDRPRRPGPRDASAHVGSPATRRNVATLEG